MNAELAEALPVSGLQLLAYHRFVETRRTHSRSSWKRLTTEEQIRLLLSDCQIDMQVPSHLTNFVNVQQALGPDSKTGQPRDALRCIIDMRNTAIHPTRDKPAIWNPYEWTEASLVGRDYLLLAILNTIEYEGSYRAQAATNRWIGSYEQVPWTP